MKKREILQNFMMFLAGIIFVLVILTVVLIVRRHGDNEDHVDESVLETVAVQEDTVVSESVDADADEKIMQESIENAESEDVVSETGELVPIIESVSETDKPSGTGEKDEIPGNNIQVVVMGDSQWDNFRMENGIAAQMLENFTDFTIYNCAFGGASAAILDEDSHDQDQKSLPSLVDIACGRKGNVFDDVLAVHNAVARCNFFRTNYFVIAYGINDFFQGAPIRNGYNPGDKCSYAGAIRYAVETINKTYPNAKIVLVSPSYVANNPKNNYGTVDAYIAEVQALAREYNTMYFNPNEYIGITISNAGDYLVDGTHLSDSSRAKYATGLSKLITADFYK